MKAVDVAAAADEIAAKACELDELIKAKSLELAGNKEGLAPRDLNQLLSTAAVADDSGLLKKMFAGSPGTRGQGQ